MELAIPRGTRARTARRPAAVALAAGIALAIAIASPARAAPGIAMAWGFNNDGELGNGTTEGSDVPVAVGGLQGLRALAAGTHHSLALLDNGTVMAWGDNDEG